MADDSDSCFVITGSLTREGSVVYLAADGAWELALEDAQAFSDSTTAETRLETVKTAEGTITEPYVFEAKCIDGKISPYSAREQLRAQGPSTRLRRPDGAGAL